VAHEVLLRVERDAAWAERALNAALSRSGMSPRDCALATELVYGTLRNEQWLDFLLGQFARRPLRKMPRAALLALRLGAYQILRTRVPPHTAIDEAVSLVRCRHPHLAGFTNAILRRLAERHAVGDLPDPANELDDPVEAIAVSGSHPAWLVRRVAELRGLDAARAWVDANNQTPILTLRVNPLRTSSEALLAALGEAGAEASAVPGVPNAIWVRGGGRVDAMPGYAEGHFVVQDLGAQLAGLMVEVPPGAVVLDACAAPGGKSTHVAERMENRGVVLSLDQHQGKTRLIADNAARLGLTCIEPICADAADPVALRRLLDERSIDAVDLVILDAPCSGLGTLRRHPELRRRQPEDVLRACDAQDDLLDSVSRIIKWGGALLYVVCSILPEEGRARVDAFLRNHSELELVAPTHPALEPFLVDHPAAPKSLLVTWPDLHGADGFFAARLRRIG